MQDCSENANQRVTDSSRIRGGIESRVPDRFTFFWIVIAYGLSALGAYQIFSIPLQWLGSGILLLPFLVLLYKGERYPTAALLPALLVMSLIVVSLFGWLIWGMSIDFPYLLPTDASTSYPVFTFLRYFQLIVFIVVYVLVLSFLKKNGLDRLAHIIVIGGVVAALYAIYVYAAHVYGLPEIPRTRMGTGGDEQSIIFAYAFHRALGSFREPSHLAEWLVVPFFMTFWGRGYGSLIARLLITFVLLLSGSLTGIVSVITAYFLSVTLIFPIWTAVVRLLTLALVVLFVGLMFSVFAYSYDGETVNIFAVLWERIYPLLEGGGLAASNRDYVYGYAASHSIPLLGYGFGNANILLSEYLGSGLVSSFLNLYLNMLYAVGYLGFIVVVVFLLFPLVWLLRLRRMDRYQLLSLSGSYIGWLLVYLVHSEELSVSFAILYGACIYYCLQYGESVMRQPVQAEIPAD